MKVNKVVSIFLFLIPVFVFQSCTKQGPDSDQQVYPILFSNLETRAIAVDADIQTNGFKAYAFYSVNGTSHNFDGNVKYDSQNSVWSFEDPKYWILGAEFYFRSFYPKALTAGTLTVNNATPAQSFNITDFDITKQEDVMTASATETVPDNKFCPVNGSIVDLHFEHLLACVEIHIKSEVDGVIVNSISLVNISNGGSYNGSSWSASSNNASVDCQSGIRLTKGDDFVDVSNGGFLVIPGVNSGRTLNISASNKDYNGVVIPGGTWEIGKKYIYTLTIKQSDIIFVDQSPYVNEWDSESATGSVIIK